MASLGEVPMGVEDLIERDGPSCVWCGRELWRRDLTVEHVVPRSRGGRTTSENTVVACRSCNRRRGSRPVDAYVRHLRVCMPLSLLTVRGLGVAILRPPGNASPSPR
jgi:HNH endonuclease